MGYEPIREQRLQRMRELGIIQEDQVPAGQHPLWPDWDELSPEVKQLEVLRMQVYAGMIDAMDYHVGRVLDHL